VIFSTESYKHARPQPPFEQARGKEATRCFDSKGGAAN
jgi:hypothetical protein